MKTLNMILLVTVILLVSCAGEEEKSELPVYDLVELSDPEPVLLSSLCDDIDYIPLETGEEVLGNVRGVKYSEGRYAVRSGSSISVFGKEGRENYVIDKQGKGPDEYLSGSVFDYDGDKNEVLVYDSGHNRILSYNEKEEIVRKIKEVTLVNAFKLMGDGNLFISAFSPKGDSKFSQVIINPGGDTLARVENKFKFEPTVMIVFMNECVTYSRDNRLFYHELMDDTIFCVDKNLEIYPYAVLNTGDLRFTVEKRTNISMTGKFDAIFVNDIIETEDHFFVENRGKGHLILKDAGETIVLEDGALLNDLDGGLPFYPDLLVDDKNLVQVVDAFEFNLWLESDHFKNFIDNPEKKEEFRVVAEKLTENDNPVLVRCRLR
ncbi:MAG: 6-bladed beta-propeller [Bacteroidales bacterium]|nr:6-bladed beta-propeller [Bacteroidales bacterium]